MRTRIQSLIGRNKPKGLAVVLGVLLLMLGCPVWAQQIPISDMYIVNPKWMNPAAMGTVNLNHVLLSHQQRKIGWGVRSMSQFLNYQSGPQGRSRNFGWGLFLNNDIEHTEQRISVNVAFAAQVYRTQFSTLSVGINGGLINWSSSYGSNRVYDRSDVLLAKPTNFAELDAGAGVRYSFTNYFLRSEVNAAASQLPGNLISNSVKGIVLSPHIMAGGSALFSFDNNFYIGPLGFYRNTFLRAPATIQKATFDLGAKAEILRWGMWASAAYRINQAAFTGGFGMKVINPDTLFENSRAVYFLGLNATASYPMNSSSIFGPSFELGITLSFGQVGEGDSRQDTLQQIRGAFWKNDGNINNHKGKRLMANAPPNLRAITQPNEKSVLLSYSWDDNVYAYVGEHPEYAYDTLLSAVGTEWIGIDGIVSNMATEVIKEALFPDTLNTQFPDSIERLRDLTSIEINGYLKADELAADFGAQGTVYKGDLPGRRNHGDTLRIALIYGDRDTVIVIKKGDNLSNLQLATLKLHTMRKKFEYEFNKYYGRDMALVWEGESINDEKTKGRKIVYLKKLELTPNHPNQKPFMVGQMRVNFTRIPGYFEQRALAEGGKGGKKGKNKRDTPAKGKDAFRDPVGTRK